MSSRSPASVDVPDRHPSIELRPDTIRRATQVGVSRERIVLVLGPSPVRQLTTGYRAVYVGGKEGYSAIAFDAGTGAIAWRTKL